MGRQPGSLVEAAGHGVRDGEGAEEQCHLPVNQTHATRFFAVRNGLAVVSGEGKGTGKMRAGGRGIRVQHHRPAECRDRPGRAPLHQSQVAEHDVGPGIAIIERNGAGGMPPACAQRLLALNPAHRHGEHQAEPEQAARRRLVPAAALCVMGMFLMPLPTTAQQQLVIRLVAERRLAQLPPGPLYWRIDRFTTLAEAQAAAGPTALAAEVSGRVWLFTLGPRDGASSGGGAVAVIGPVPPIVAPACLPRINHASGPPGTGIPVHTHPGSEASHVLAGRLGQRTPQGTHDAEAGQSMNGHPADTPMEVFSAGSVDLDQLVMFVVDAARPFSSHARVE